MRIKGKVQVGNVPIRRVKHDRYSSLSKGTVCNLIHAIGALYLLNIYYKNIKYRIKYKNFLTFDFSLGSSIFSVNMPEEEYVIDVINNCQCQAKLQSNSSPYILKYTDASYKRILEINNKIEEDINNFIKQQPEFNEKEFLDQIKVQKDKGRVILFSELCKYRINKKIPVNLSFKERKKLLIESEEWNSNLMKTSVSKKEDEITVENIQEEIDNAGKSYGLKLQESFEKDRFFQATNNEICELVLDDGNIKYSV